MLWLAILSLIIGLGFSGSELQKKGGRFYVNRELMYIFCDLCTFFCDSEGPLIGFTFCCGVQTDAEDGGKYRFVGTFWRSCIANWYTIVELHEFLKHACRTVEKSRKRMSHLTKFRKGNRFTEQVTWCTYKRRPYLRMLIMKPLYRDIILTEN